MEQDDELRSRLSGVHILVVDDEEYVRRDIEKSLQAAGYTVDLAGDNSQAIEKIGKHHYHVALIDLRMPDFTGQLSPTAGVDLLKRIRAEFPGLSVIVLTGTATVETAKECIKLGALDYFEKGFSSAALGVHIQKALPDELVGQLLKGIPINWNLKIVPAEPDILTHSEDLEILQRLFYDSRAIKVSLIAKGSSSARIYKITSQDKDEAWRQPVVVKIGRKPQIQKEIFNYETYVKDKLTRYPQLREPAFTTNRGGIVMPFLNLVADELRTFRDFFFRSSESAIVQTLEKLFNETLGYWYRTTRKQEPVFVFQAYSDSLGAEKWDLDSALRRYLKDFIQGDQIELPDSLGKFANPIPLFHLMKKRNWGYSDDAAYISVAHGDLNVSNVLVDSGHNCWIIDFTRTGKAHILRDFVQFEAAIKYTLLDSVNLRERLEFERTLLTWEKVGEHESISFSDPLLHKAMRAVMATRTYAKHFIGGEALFPSYMIGSLFYNMDMLRYFEGAVSSASRLCILFAANIMIDELGKMGLKP